MLTVTKESQEVVLGVTEELTLVSSEKLWLSSILLAPIPHSGQLNIMISTLSILITVVKINCIVAGDLLIFIVSS